MDDEGSEPVTSRSTRGPRLPLHRDPGDAWVEAADGSRYWGRFGAAGLLVHDPHRGVLLQHRASWSHHGDTWGVPGGALHQDEAPFDGACREAAEEADVPRELLEPIATVVVDRAVWKYTTVVARTSRPFDARAVDAESHELRWVPLDQVEHLPLHPGFGAAWPLHREILGADRTLVVDVANVMGSVPDGWWKDRRAAAERVLRSLAGVAAEGIEASAWLSVGRSASGDAAVGASGDAGVRLMPTFVAVVEGKARDAALDPGSRVQVVRAKASGDDAIVEAVASVLAVSPGVAATHDAASAGAPVVSLAPSGRNLAGRDVVVVTADRELRARVEGLGATTVGPAWLRSVWERAPIL